MKILALETSAKSVSVAVVENGAVLASAYQNMGLTHSVTLMPLLDSILVNPALEMGQTMQKSNMMGKQVFQNPRRDGVQEVVVTKALVKEYADITTRCFAAVDADEQRRVYGLFGDKDPVVHTFDLFHSHYPQAIRFHGEHRLIEKVVHRYLIPVIRWIDDRQEGRTRPPAVRNNR